jgi:hypothetical protein
MPQRSRLLLLTLPLLLAVTGCSNGETHPVREPPHVMVRLQPASVTLPAGETQAFTAQVDNTTDTALTWTTSGGTITPQGVYTAPSTPGTYTVRATSVADASASKEALVTVTPAPPRILLFRPSRGAIAQGRSTVLDWEVTGATRLHLSPEPGAIYSGARLEVSPTQTTVYTLTAEGESGSTTATATVIVRPPAWEPLAWQAEKPEGYDSDVYRWRDANQQPRTAVLTRNELMDPGGTYGGMLRQYRFFAGPQERVATGTGASANANVKWNGWGYVVNHYDKTQVRSADVPGHYRQVFVGPHHALHEYTWELPIRDQQVKATVQWLFATGRDHPLYTITFDSSAAGPDGLTASVDSRAPYGDIAWDGDGTQAQVDGVKWGDKYRFFTRDEPLTAQSRWDYTQPNTVPYALAYSRQANAEMGLVQTLSQVQHSAGGTWFHDNWGRTSDNRVVSTNPPGPWLMPDNWNWPYQLCQYELDDTQPTRSKRVAWGLMYGSVGRPSYWGYGYERKYSGHPYQSYSVFMVVGQQSTEDVMAQVAQVERTLRAELRVTRGQPVKQGPGGVGRSDTVTYPVAGYNDTYGAYELKADEGLFQLTLIPAEGSLRNPLFLLRDMQGVPERLLLDGQELAADQDYFASYDESTRTVWLTLNGLWSGGHTLTNVRTPEQP